MLNRFHFFFLCKFDVTLLYVGPYIISWSTLSFWAGFVCVYCLKTTIHLLENKFHAKWLNLFISHKCYRKSPNKMIVHEGCCNLFDDIRFFVFAKYATEYLDSVWILGYSWCECVCVCWFCFFLFLDWKFSFVAWSISNQGWF